jgi:hypothetical protein
MALRWRNPPACSFARGTSLARWHQVSPPDWMPIVVVAVAPMV